VKAAEWLGFSLDCAHDLDLLPVVDFSYSYRCLTCGGVIRVPWHETLASMNQEALRQHAEQVIAMESEREVPEFTA
jgi:hypothetical protein